MEENIVEMKKWHDTMRKFIFGGIVVALVVGVVVYCSHDEWYQIKDWTWKEEKLMDLIHNWNPEPRRYNFL